MSWLTLFLFIFFVALLTQKILTIFFAQASKTTNTLIIKRKNAQFPVTQAQIPNIIWSYWHQAPAPEFIAHCKANWQHFAPDHEVRMLFKDDITTWIDASTITTQFDRLPAYRQADWLRLQLLKRYGGIWIDASTILTQDLNWLHQLQQQHHSEYLGFYLNGFTTRIEQPIIENWFMAAIPNCSFIVDLADEFGHAIDVGEAQYLAQLQAQGKRERIVQGMDDGMQKYLIMHVAASVLLDKWLDRYDLTLIRAEDSAFAFHSILQWNKRKLYLKLVLMPCPSRLPALIKLRGTERRLFERYLARGLIYSGSFLAKYLRWKS